MDNASSQPTESQESDLTEGPESEPEHSEEVEGGDPEASEQRISSPDELLENLSDDELDRLMKQYVHYGEVAIETANQRIQMNRFFGLILTTLLAGLFGLAQVGLTTISSAAVVFAAGFGVVTCYFWYQSVQSYRRLNKARYTILNQVETALPIRMYLDEWRYLKKEKPDPELIAPRLETDPDHKSHTNVELWYVRLLGAGYLTVGGYALGFLAFPWVEGTMIAASTRTLNGFVLAAVGLTASMIFLWIQNR